MERAEFLARGELPFGLPRGIHRRIVEHGHEGVDRCVSLIDAAQEGLDHLHRGYLPGTDGQGNLGGRHADQ